jgi:hypothetical protein
MRTLEVTILSEKLNHQLKLLPVKTKQTTIRLDIIDRQIIQKIKEYYGLTSNTMAIRFALREVYRAIKMERLL